jgi:ubiquinone/menaquinone biosynthesis C-methylase UbiE
VTGIDISEKLLELARIAVPGAKFYSADIRHLSFEKNMFDGIWACASIHHIKHKELPKVFSELFAILKPGGVLYIHVKKGEGEMYIEEPSIPGKKRFYSLFSKELLKKYCEDAGFTVLDVFDIVSKQPYTNGQIERMNIACFAKKI